MSKSKYVPAPIAPDLDQEQIYGRQFTGKKVKLTTRAIAALGRAVTRGEIEEAENFATSILDDASFENFACAHIRK